MLRMCLWPEPPRSCRTPRWPQRRFLPWSWLSEVGLRCSDWPILRAVAYVVVASAPPVPAATQQPTYLEDGRMTAEHSLVPVQGTCAFQSWVPPVLPADQPHSEIGAH